MKAWRQLRRIVVVLALAGSVAAQENPHSMTLPDGSTDAGKCAYCHNDDLTLTRSKAETCTLCHAETVHSGAAEHARANAAAVALAMKGRESPVLPLTDDGRMYCGTCHLFHDPAVMGEALLEKGRAARSSTLNEAVQEGVAARARRENDDATIEFATEGTRYLRMPASDDALCKHCHGSY